mmetsp:Transcript_44502/g.141693  ORF Transcript_44502/g.141693 Transcript_44502/m.141693 type:complete len:238 (-) Transcript_44502:95-808(-)
MPMPPTSTDATMASPTCFCMPALSPVAWQRATRGGTREGRKLMVQNADENTCCAAPCAASAVELCMRPTQNTSTAPTSGIMRKFMIVGSHNLRILPSRVSMHGNSPALSASRGIGEAAGANRAPPSTSPPSPKLYRIAGKSFLPNPRATSPPRGRTPWLPPGCLPACLEWSFPPPWSRPDGRARCRASVGLKGVGHTAKARPRPPDERTFRAAPRATPGGAKIDVMASVVVVAPRPE